MSALIKKDNPNVLWDEKYRPRKLENLLLPKRLKDKFIDFEQNSKNLLLAGPHGTGKSTLAGILTESVSVLKINASLNNGIDTVRTKIQDFVCTGSIINRSAKKVVWLDEADNFTESGQKALRGFIETYHKNAIFILTANFPEKIINPLKSRLTEIEFSFSDAEDLEQKRAYIKRILFILKSNGFGISQEALTHLIKVAYPDLRSIIKTLQFACSNLEQGATIQIDDITKVSLSKYEELYDFLCTEFRPDKIFSYVKSNFLNKETDAMKGLASDFLTYLDLNGKSEKVLPIAVISQRYNYELPNSIDKLVTLLAACSAMSNTLK